MASIPARYGGTNWCGRRITYFSNAVAGRFQPRTDAATRPVLTDPEAVDTARNVSLKYPASSESLSITKLLDEIISLASPL